MLFYCVYKPSLKVSYNGWGSSSLSISSGAGGCKNRGNTLKLKKIPTWWMEEWITGVGSGSKAVLLKNFFIQRLKPDLKVS